MLYSAYYPTCNALSRNHYHYNETLLFLHNKPALSCMQLSERQQLSMTCCVNTQHRNNNNTIQIHVRFTNIVHTIVAKLIKEIKKKKGCGDYDKNLSMAYLTHFSGLQKYMCA